MSGVATAIAGGAIVGGIISSNAAKSAASTQANATENAAQAQLQQFNTINQQQAPYRTSGYGALSDLNNFLGIQSPAPAQTADNFDAQAYLAANPDVAANWKSDPYQHYLQYGKNEGRAFTGNDTYNQQLQASKAGPGTPGFGQFTHQFNANDLTANLAPNYAFMLKQGQGQVGNTLNSTNGILSGNAQQGLNQFTQDYAKNAYQNAFENYNTNQTNIYNRLASLAGLGQQSLNTSANYGTQATQSANNFLTSGAAAQAAGTVGQANALSGALNSLGTAGAYYGMTH